MRAVPTLSTAALLLGVALALPAQKKAVVVTDSRAGADELSYSDAVALRAWSNGSEVFFEVEMQRPLIEGMFTCLHVYIDADNNEKTGIDGSEIWLRAAVGSRFHPNGFKPREGDAAMDILRASLSHLDRTGQHAGRDGLEWLHAQVLDQPVVTGKKLRLRVSIPDLRQHGARYKSVVGIRAEVETTCTDQPIMLRHLCKDEGIAVKMDGFLDDWSSPRIITDARGELHKVAQFLDVTTLRAEHDKNHLYVAVQLAEKGLRRDHLITRDVQRMDGVTIFVEPLYPRYQGPLRAVISYGSGGQTGLSRDRSLNWRATIDENTIEFRMQRKHGQNALRVWVWSDLRRRDWLGAPNEFVQFDWEKVQ